MIWRSDNDLTCIPRSNGDDKSIRQALAELEIMGMGTIKNKKHHPKYFSNGVFID